MDAGAQRRAAWRELVFDVARDSGVVRLRVTGASMLPAMWPGDVVTVRRCEVAALRPGQIVLHGRQEKLTVHRIIHIEGDRLITRGDSLAQFDPAVTASDIVGLVVEIDRSGRHIPTGLSLWQRAVAWILRRSAVCRRIMLTIALALGGYKRRSGDTQVSWVG